MTLLFVVVVLRFIAKLRFPQSESVIIIIIKTGIIMNQVNQ